MISNLSFFKDFKTLSLHRKIYIIGFMIMVLGLPLSRFFMSISQFILLINWLIEGNFKEKYNRFVKNKTGIILLLLPFIHIIWLINTTNFHFAAIDLRIKIPLLLLTVILGSIEPLNNKEIKWILNTFVFAVFAATIVGFAIFTGLYKVENYSFRALSHFISHIIFSLMLVLSLVILIYNLDYQKLTKKHITLIILLIIWLMFFLAIIQSITGWVVFLLLSLFLFVTHFRKLELKPVKFIVLTIFTLVFTISSGIIIKVIHDFYFVETVGFKNLPTHTPYGNKYKNDTLSILKENGHFINVLVCEKELSETWDKLSKIPYKTGKDSNGYSIKRTLIRYLTSMGLPKDKNGLLSLDKKDIELIEKGYSSIIYKKYNKTPYIRIYKAMWDLDYYYKTGNPNNKSIAQRIEFYKAAFYIIKNNFWVGVGTGDIRDAFAQSYIDLKSKLIPEKRFTVHNQYITFFIKFGIFGFLISLFSMLYPGFIKSKKGGVLLQSFMIIAFVSMLSDNILEIQSGVTFYSLFYNLFLFNKKVF